MLVRWSEDALAAFRGIVEHIEIGSLEAAREVATRIYDGITSLAEFPRLGRVGKVHGTRELVMAPLPCIAIYQVIHATVERMRIVHVAQRWP